LIEKIRWAPKVRQEKLWRLYQSDAGGFLDEELLDKVGYALLARCENILLIDEGKVACPRCGAIFFVRSPMTKGSAEPVTCPTPICGWQVSGEEYDLSIRHRAPSACTAGRPVRLLPCTWRLSQRPKRPRNGCSPLTS